MPVDEQLRLARWNYNLPRSRLCHWLAAADVLVDAPPDIRRLRKSTKVEKALAFGGRIADVANDHHEEVFRGHYAARHHPGIMSGQVITTAQDHWFAKAVDGPTVLTDSTDVLNAPEQAAGLGLSPQQAEDIRQAGTGHGVVAMRGSTQLALRPGRAAVSGGAVAVSGMPQRLGAAEQPAPVAAVRRPSRQVAVSAVPAAFRPVAGTKPANLQAVLADRTDEEKASARKHIDAGEAFLHLPLAASVEFDR